MNLHNLIIQDKGILSNYFYMKIIINICWKYDGVVYRHICITSYWHSLHNLLLSNIIFPIFHLCYGHGWWALFKAWPLIIRMRIISGATKCKGSYTQFMNKQLEITPPKLLLSQSLWFVGVVYHLDIRFYYNPQFEATKHHELGYYAPINNIDGVVLHTNLLYQS